MNSKMRSEKQSSNILGGLTKVSADSELKYLEKVVLGTGALVSQNIASDDDSESEISHKKSKIEPEPKKPAWIDEEDNVTFKEVVQKQKRKIKIGVNGSKKYQLIVEDKYREVMGVPKWSKLSNKSETPADNLLNRCGEFIKKAKDLDKGNIEFEILKELNFETCLEGLMITAVKFHPKSTVGMVAGSSGAVSLFQVDGKQNTKLQTLKFKRYPITCASFLKGGEEFLIGSPYYKFFYSHNLITGQSLKVNNSKLIDLHDTGNFRVSPNDDIIAACGTSGQIYLFAASSKEYIDSFQMNCNVTTLEFNHDGSILYSHGEDGEVYIWCMKTRTCMKKFFDDGCLQGSALAVSDNDQFIACGSSSGIVNVYNTEAVVKTGVVKPIKTFYNLVTPITSLKFNESSEVLAIASKAKECSLKLVHCPSMTVYANFPSQKMLQTVKKPYCLDFSPNSGYFSVGDNAGFAHLFRLKYYGNY